MALGGPVGQTPPCGPDTLMEQFISCQPAAGYRFPTASSAAWVARQLESRAESKSRPDTAPLEHYRSPTPHGRLKTHRLKMSDWTGDSQSSAVRTGAREAIHSLSPPNLLRLTCWQTERQLMWAGGVFKEASIPKGSKFSTGGFLKRTIRVGSPEIKSFRFYFIGSSDVYCYIDLWDL